MTAKAVKPALERLNAGATRYRRILVALVVGFTVVIMLLAAALLIAFLRTRAIQRSSASQVRAHLLTAGLVDQLQWQRQRINNILFRAARFPKATPKALLDEVRSIEKDVHQIIGEARGAGLPVEWNELDEVMSKLRRQAELSLQQPPVEAPELDELSTLFERFVQLTARIVRADADRSILLDNRIEGTSAEMLRDFFLLTAICFVIAAICAYMTIRTTNQSIRQIEWQAEELNRVSWHMLESQEATARRFSHEMHDELGQSLTGLKVYLSATKREEFEARRVECVRLLEEAIGNVRELSQLLRPVILDDFGLDAGLRWLCERFTMRTRIQVEYESNVEGRPREEVETHFFRIAQEALTNVARHSGASTVQMRLDLSSGQYRLTVEDNGKGIVGNGKESPSLGMVGMRARARQVGGEFTVKMGKQGGLRLEAWAPVVETSHTSDDMGSWRTDADSIH